jgi:hypothetical protein
MTFTRSTHVVLLISSIMDLLPLGTDVIKDDFGGKLPSGRPDVHGRRPDVRPRPRLPRGRVFTVRRRGKNRVRADALASARTRNFLIYFYLFICFYFLIYFW